MIGRGFVEWQGVAFVWLMVLWRYTFSAIALPLRLQRKVLIIGAGGAGQEIQKIIKHHQNSGLVVAGFLDDNPQKMGTSLNGAPVLGNTSQLDEIIAQYKIGMVVVAITHEKSSPLLNNLVRLSFMGVQVIDMPSLYEFLAAKIPTDHISDVWLLFHSLNRSQAILPPLQTDHGPGIGRVGIGAHLAALGRHCCGHQNGQPGTGFFPPGTPGKRWQALPDPQIPHHDH